MTAENIYSDFEPGWSDYDESIRHSETNTRLPSNGWSEERVEALINMRAAGYSATQIAQRLGGITKNAVIGKSRRLGLKRLKPGGRAISAKHTKRRASPQFEPDAVSAREIPPALESDPCSIWELNDSRCRWPIGDPGDPDFHFCGGKAARGKSYCAHHANAAAEQPKGKERVSA